MNQLLGDAVAEAMSTGVKKLDRWHRTRNRHQCGSAERRVELIQIARLRLAVGVRRNAVPVTNWQGRPISSRADPTEFPRLPNWASIPLPHCADACLRCPLSLCPGRLLQGSGPTDCKGSEGRVRCFRMQSFSRRRPSCPAGDQRANRRPRARISAMVKFRSGPAAQPGDR